MTLLPTILLAAACAPRADDTVVPTVPTAPADPCDAWSPPRTWTSNEAPASIVQAFQQERAALGAEGVAWAILQDGEIRYAGADGDADEGVPMTPTALLRTGSTLKMQTAALVLALEAAGVMSVDDTLSTHLPEFDMAASPFQAGTATLHELLSHQGGFYDYTPIDGPAGENALYNHAHGAFADQYFLMVEPGSFWNYSNPNFSLAGLAAQEAAGVPYRALMRDALWDPLCMPRSTFDAADVEADGDFARATTTNWETGSGTVRVGPGSYDHGFSAPAGFGWSSVEEMLHFAHFLLEGQDELMPGGLRAALTTSQADTHELPGGLWTYGYGVSLEPGYTSRQQWRSTPLWRHNGAIPGYAAELVIHPESGVAVAILSNTDGAYYPRSIAEVLDTLVDPPTGPFPDTSFDASTFGRYAGAYEDVFNVGRVDVAWDGTTLTLDAPDLDAYAVPYGTTLTPVGGSGFVWSVQGQQLVVHFLDDPDGDVRWIRHRAFVIERLDEPTPASGVRPMPPGLPSLRETLAREPLLR